MTAAVVIDMRSPDHEWAEAEMAAIATDITDYHEHVRNLFDNWTEGRNVSRFYPDSDTPAQAFIAKYPGVLTKSGLNRIGRAHRMRQLLGGAQRTTYELASDRTLDAFGDPGQWEAEKALAIFEKAQAIAEQRIADMEAKGRKASRGVIDGDIREAMGRPRSVGTSSVGYWHNVLHSLTTFHAGLDEAMLDRIIETAQWAKKRLS